jgi:D-alanine transaminase
MVQRAPAVSVTSSSCAVSRHCRATLYSRVFISCVTGRATGGTPHRSRLLHLVLVMPLDSTRVCWVNGEYLPESEARVSIFDRGLLFADGVYEVAAAFNGRALDADLHLARLERSLAAIQIRGGLSTGEWSGVVQSLIESNGIAEGFVYLEVTRGVADRDFPFPPDAQPTQFAYARAKSLRNDPNASGVALHSVPDIRWDRRDIKSVALLAQVLAKQEARVSGAFEALMHEDGVVTEGGSSNVWIVQDGMLRTRALSNKILAGITRDVVMQLAFELGMPVDERPFTVSDAISADECFMTSATSFVLPVTRIDGRTIGNGSPGRCTMAVRTAYLERAGRLTAGA